MSSLHTTIKGSGRCRAFTTGHRFTLTDYFSDDLNNKDYLLTRIKHTLTHAGSYLGDSSTEEEASYTNTFRGTGSEPAMNKEGSGRQVLVTGISSLLTRSAI